MSLGAVLEEMFRHARRGRPNSVAFTIALCTDGDGGGTQPRALIRETGLSSGACRNSSIGSTVQAPRSGSSDAGPIGAPSSAGPPLAVVRNSNDARVSFRSVALAGRSSATPPDHNVVTVPVTRQGDPENSSSTVLPDDRRTVPEVVVDPLGGIVGVTDAAMAARRGAEHNVGHLVAPGNKRGRPTLRSPPASVESVRLDPEPNDPLTCAPDRTTQRHLT